MQDQFVDQTRGQGRGDGASAHERAVLVPGGPRRPRPPIPLVISVWRPDMPATEAAALRV